MSKNTAQRLAESAIQFQLAQLALKIAALPDDQISAASPEILELKELVAATAR